MPLARHCDLWHYLSSVDHYQTKFAFKNEYDIQIKLLSENELIICAYGNIHYQISREKFKPEPGLKPRIKVKLVC